MTGGEDRKGKFIAVANMKGGVGKTTTVVSLAEALAADDDSKKILVIDLDPQSSASVAIAGDESLNELIDKDRTFEAFLSKKLITKERAKIQDMIHPTICGTTHRNQQLNVALLPCGPNLRKVERKLLHELAQKNISIASSDGQITKLFKSDILKLSDEYDYILFDCAPGISPVTEIAIRLSDLIIVPTIPDRLSVYGLNAFYESIWDDEETSLPKPKVSPTVLVVRMDQRINQHREVLAALEDGAKERASGYKLFLTQIPTSAALVAALTKPDVLTFIQKYTPNVIAQILSPLVREVKGML
jgi:chromosome partitioning protein